MNKAVAIVLCAALIASGCASGGYRFAVRQQGQAAPRSALDPESIAAFARQVPVGTVVRVRSAGGPTIRGTLLRVTDTMLVVEPRTRIMEPPVELPLDRIIGIEVDQPNNIGKAVAIGVGTGAAAALGVFLLLLAIVAND